ncbi:MAG: glycosyltransferase family 4 protein [Chloroflexi bacterium]|nr:glycosyltransferase family 4 protein [Chloroflexota bacterium]
MPSLSHDACPVAVLEAMALGVPVVASRMGGLPDLVRDGETGLLVQAGDARGLAAALERLSESPETVQRMGAAARRRAEAEFDVEVYYRRLMEIYRESVSPLTARAAHPAGTGTD